MPFDPFATTVAGRTITIVRGEDPDFPQADGQANQPVGCARVVPSETAKWYTVHVQEIKGPPIDATTSQPDTDVDLRITYSVGSASYVKIVKICGPGATGSREKMIPILSDSINVELVWSLGTFDGSASPAFIVFNVGVLPGNLASALYLAPAWYSPQLDLGEVGQGLHSKYTFGPDGGISHRAPGVVHAASGVLIANPGAVLLYPMLIDNGSNFDGGGPPANCFPIPGGLAPPVLSAGDAFAFSDDVDPQIGFSLNLWMVLSTTPHKYTAPAANTTFIGHVKLSHAGDAPYLDSSGG